MLFLEWYFYFTNTQRVFYFKYINIWDFNVNAEIKDQHPFDLVLFSEVEMKEVNRLFSNIF